MEVFSTHVTIARPIGDDPGTVEIGHYTVDGDTVTLTRQDGEPIASGRMQLGYSSKVGAGETSRQVAQRLIWRHYRATKSGTDFNRPLTYRNYGVV